MREGIDVKTGISPCRRAAAAACVALALAAAEPVRADDVKDAKETIQVFKKADPGIAKFFKGSLGYVVFPTSSRRFPTRTSRTRRSA